MRQVLAAGLVIGALGASHPASAGALGDVVSGLGKAAGESGGGGGGGSSGGDVVSAVVNGLFSGGWDDHSRSSAADPTYVYSPGYAPYSTGPDPTEVSFYAGIQSVEHSDGAMTLEMTVTYQDFGIALRGTGFYETEGSGDEAQHVELDLGSMAAVYRGYHDDDLSFWLEGGLGGVSTSNDLHFWGLFAGARLDRKLGGELSASAEARYFRMEDDVTATEARAGVQISVLRVSYRVVDFNVGPPLMGPEVGVALTF